MNQIVQSVAIEPRAGLVPYIHDTGGQIRYLTMISSSPIYGGPRPMISKGKVEDGETTKQAAYREAEEELGLKLSNVDGKGFLVADEYVTLRSANYQLTVYAVEVISKYNFNMWGSETGAIEWLTLEEFRQRGRKDHLKYIEAIERWITK